MARKLVAGPKERRFDLSKEEKTRMAKLQEIADSLKLQHDGMVDSMAIELKKVQQRLDLNDIPEGTERVINFDSQMFELIVTDFNKEDLKKAKEVVDKEEINKKLKGQKPVLAD